MPVCLCKKAAVPVQRKLCVLLPLVILILCLLRTGSVHAQETGSCGDNCTWSFDAGTGVLSLTGSGPMDIYLFHQRDFGNDIQKITIGEDITTISSGAFINLKSLKSVSLPKSLTEIGAYAFRNCTSLESITIPAAVSTIGSDAFLNCTSLTSIEVNPGSLDFKSIDGVLFSKDGKKLIAYPAGKSGASYTVPAGTVTIGAGAFCYNQHLRVVILPAGVTGIEEDAFLSCWNLSSINFPKGLETIGRDAFVDTKLESVTLPQSLTLIGERAFRLCKSLKSVIVLSDKLPVLTGDYVFQSVHQECTFTYLGNVYPIAEWKYTSQNLYPITIQRPNIVSVRTEPDYTFYDRNYYLQGRRIDLDVTVSEGSALEAVYVNDEPISPDSSSWWFIMPKENVTISADTSLIPYAISYPNAENGRDGVTNPNPKTYSKNIITVLQDAFRRGYSFGGWYETADCSGSPVKQIPWGSTGDRTFYAKWIPDIYTVTFDVNGGTGSMADQSFAHGVPQALTPHNPQTFYRSGYGFEGWNTDPDGKGTHYDDGETITITEDLKLYARWEAGIHTVTFIANGGEGHMGYEKFAYGSTRQLKPNTFTRTGYEFSGWNTKADGSGTPYADGQTVNITGDLTLHAQWTPLKYTVQFDANGGTGSMPDQTFTHDEPQALNVHQFKFEGFGFDSWNTEKDGSGTKYHDGEKITVTGDMMLYAQWDADMHTVTFIANGGTGHMDAEQFPFGSAQSLTPNAFTREGFTFTGWNTEADGSGTAYADGQTVNISGDLTLYAQWAAGRYTVQFDANGGTGSMQPQSFELGQEQALTRCSFSREGFLFLGWNTLPDGSGTNYGDGQTVRNLSTEDGAVVTLYALWTDRLTHVITFDANDGSGRTNQQRVEDSVKTRLTPNEFYRDGYRFIEWNTEADGSGTAYADEDYVSLTGDLTLYAQWKKDTGPEEEMELTVEFTSLVKGHRAVPPEIGGLTIAPVRIILSGGENRSESEDVSLTLTGGGDHTISLKVKFQKLPEDPAPGKYEVSVTGLPGTVYGREQIYMAGGSPEGDVLWKYHLTYAAEINRKGKEMIVRVWLIWDDGHRPDDDIAIYALPEDEIGAYVQYDDGTKEYLLFHTYALCMDWLGDDALCRGYERCFHKESPYVNPFVTP